MAIPAIPAIPHLISWGAPQSTPAAAAQVSKLASQLLLLGSLFPVATER